MKTNRKKLIEVPCNLTRADQQGEKVFACFAYRPSSPSIDLESILRALCSQTGLVYPEGAEVTRGEEEKDVRF